VVRALAGGVPEATCCRQGGGLEEGGWGWRAQERRNIMAPGGVAGSERHKKQWWRGQRQH